MWDSSLATPTWTGSLSSLTRTGRELPSELEGECWNTPLIIVKSCDLPIVLCNGEHYTDHGDRDTCYTDHGDRDTCYTDHGERDTCYMDHGELDTCYTDHDELDTCYTDHGDRDTCYTDHGELDTCYTDHGELDLLPTLIW